MYICLEKNVKVEGAKREQMVFKIRKKNICNLLKNPFFFR